jgi:tetratricopeptide (TPR) repeat protein
LASAIVSALQLQLSPSAAAASAPNVTRGTSNLEAFDLYLRGQFNLRRRGAGIRLAADNFRQAIAKDSNFARAYSGLSAALELFPYFAGVSPDSVFDRVMAAARRALSLDSTLAEAHTSIALAYQHAFQWQRAEEEHRRAIRVDSTDAAAHMHYARFLTYVARPRDALVEAQRAKSLDPYSAVNAGWVVNTLRFTGQLDAAVIEARRSIELDSANPLALTSAANALIAAGRPDEARKLAARINRSLPFIWPGIVANILATAGDVAMATRLVRDIESMRPRPWGAETTLAFAFLSLGDSSRALDALERALDAREMWPTNLSLLERMYDPVRHSPRFAALLRRVGLDPNLFSAPARPR